MPPELASYIVLHSLSDYNKNITQLWTYHLCSLDQLETPNRCREIASQPQTLRDQTKCLACSMGSQTGPGHGQQSLPSQFDRARNLSEACWTTKQIHKYMNCCLFPEVSNNTYSCEGGLASRCTGGMQSKRRVPSNTQVL